MSVAAKDRPVAADERRAELAVAAVADRALHVALQRDVDPLGRDAALRSASAAKRIITSGPQTNAVAARGSKPAPAIELRHDADLAAPVRVRRCRP